MAKTSLHAYVSGLLKLIEREKELTIYNNGEVYRDLKIIMQSEEIDTEAKCNGNCKPQVMSYDMNCPIHGWT